MPIHFTISRSPKSTLLSVWKGVVKLDDWNYFAGKVSGHPEYQQIRAGLVILDALDIRFSLEEIQRDIQSYGEGAGRPEKTAVVAQFSQEYSRQLEQVCQDAFLHVIVFDSLHPACTWINWNLPDANEAMRRLLRKA